MYYKCLLLQFFNLILKYLSTVFSLLIITKCNFLTAIENTQHHHNGYWQNYYFGN